MRNALIALGALALVAACGERKSAEAPSSPSQTPAQPSSASEVSAIDQFGPVASEITDASFWVHPSISFNSLLIAATKSGLVAFNIEDGAEVAKSEGWEAGGLAVFYRGAFSRDAEGSARRARGFVIASDKSAGAYRAFEVDNETRALQPLAISGAPKPGDGFCAGPQSARLAGRLAVLTGKSLALYDVEIARDGLAFADATSLSLPADAVACAINPFDGALYVLLKNGEVLRRVESQNVAVDNYFASGAEIPAALGVALNEPPAGAPTDMCCGQLFVLDRKDATVRLFDLEDGHALGAVRLKSTYDVEGVTAATALGVGSGNFGGVYRDGVVALATDGENPAVRLTPLNGIMDALGVPIGLARNPRLANPRPDEVQCADPALTEDQKALCAGDEAFSLPAPEIKAPE